MLSFADLFHTGFVVDDVEAAMEENSPVSSA